MRSVMTHSFSHVPAAEIQRSVFDRSHGYKTTFNAGELIPFFVEEALPGDTFNVRLNAFVRMATPLKAPMDNIFLDTFFFAVPNRLVWDNWQKFNGEQDAPGDSTDFLVPIFTQGAWHWDTGSLADYMGIPTQVNNLVHTSLAFRAYHLIWNQWFRDENLQNPVYVPKGNGPDDPGQFLTPLRRGKRHDYFTSALPWPQKGPSVSLPLGTSAPLIGVAGHAGDPYGELFLADSVNNTNTLTAGGGGALSAAGLTGTVTGAVINVPLYGTADLTNATAATINALREAVQVQKLYERDARGGTRYTEIIRAHFGVTSDDARLQRPEYLGGGESNINIHPVSQTSASVAGVTPQGNITSFATGAVNGHGFTKSFTEHCIVIGMMSVRADLTYQQGLNRMFSRRTRFDHYWPALAHLGEQPVLNKEIFAQGSNVDEQVFGYQERYAEYRYKPSQITGKFRSNTPGGSLDYWHLSQDFLSLPVLSAAFIEDNPPISRIVAVPSEPQFLFDSYIQFKAARPMPVYGVPGMMDHF